MSEICDKCGEIHEQPSKGWKQNYGEPVRYTECDMRIGCGVDGDHHRHPSQQYMHPITRIHKIEISDVEYPFCTEKYSDSDMRILDNFYNCQQKSEESFKKYEEGFTHWQPNEVLRSTKQYNEEMLIIDTAAAMVDADIKNGMGCGLSLYQHMQDRMHDVRRSRNKMGLKLTQWGK